MTDRPGTVRRSAPRHRLATYLCTLAVPAITIGVMIAVSLGWRSDLPDPVASHWGPDGVDGYSSLTGLLVPITAIIVATSLGACALGIWLGRESMTRRLANGVAVWSAVFLAGTLLATLHVQRGLTDASSAGGIGGALAAALLVATVAAGLAVGATPGDAPAPAQDPIPADAAVLPVAPVEQVTWVREVGRRSSVPVAAGVLAFCALIALITGEWLFGAALALVLGPALVATTRWTVTVDHQGLTARSMLRRPRLHVRLDEVEQAEAVHVDPFGEFGGWGLRVGFDGRTGVVLRKGSGLQVRRTGGRVTVVTVDDAETGAALLNALAARTR